MTNQGLFSLGNFEYAVLVTQGLDGYWRIYNKGPGSLKVEDGLIIGPGNSADVFKPKDGSIIVAIEGTEYDQKCSGWYEAVSIR